MMPSEVVGLLPTVQRRYKVYDIPKRSGGFRSIAQPAREVKSLQQAVVSGLLKQLPVHPNATAYRNGVGLIANAAPHAGHNAILKLDFENFFNSIKQSDFEDHLRRVMPRLSLSDIELAGLICFWKSARRASPVLSVGAPSSPIISNIMLYNLDVALLQIADDVGANYTRYADDMTFSHPSAGALWRLLPIIENAIRRNARPVLRLNNQKTKVFSPKNHRGVTGLTLSNDGLISLGRARKRRIQSTVHHFLLGKLDSERIRELGGWLSFAKEVEPGFIDRLEVKYQSSIYRLVCDAISASDKAAEAA
jgi:hypothetical protein